MSCKWPQWASVYIQGVRIVFWEEKLTVFEEKKGNVDILEKKCTLIVILDFQLLRQSNLKIPIFFTHRCAGRFLYKKLAFSCST